MAFLTASFQLVFGAVTSNKKVVCVHPTDEPHTKSLEEFEQFLTTKSDVRFWAKLCNFLPKPLRGIASDFLGRKLHVRRKIDLRALLGGCEYVI